MLPGIIISGGSSPTELITEGVIRPRISASDLRIFLVDPASGVVDSLVQDLTFALRDLSGLAATWEWVLGIYDETRGPDHPHWWYEEEEPALSITGTSSNPIFAAGEGGLGKSTWVLEATAFNSGGIRLGTVTASFVVDVDFVAEFGVVVDSPFSVVNGELVSVTAPVVVVEETTTEVIEVRTATSADPAEVLETEVL